MTEHNAGLTAEQACEIVLGLFDGVMRDGKPLRCCRESNGFGSRVNAGFLKTRNECFLNRA